MTVALLLKNRMLVNQYPKTYIFSLSKPPYIIGHDSFFESCNEAMGYDFPSYFNMILKNPNLDYIDLRWLNVTSAYHNTIGGMYD